MNEASPNLAHREAHQSALLPVPGRSTRPVPEPGSSPVCAPYQVASGSFGGFLEQQADAVRALCTLRMPVFHTSQIHSQTLFLTAGDRVEEPHALNEAAVASS